jgi:hypothetical protein
MAVAVRRPYVHPVADMPARDRRSLVLLALAATVALALLVQLAGAEALLAAPFLALIVPLLAGRYVGEEQIARLAAAWAPRTHPARRIRGGAVVRRAPRVLVPRGGRLLATSLAVRPPPAALQHLT